MGLKLKVLPLSFPPVGQIDGSMWKSNKGAFVSLCFCYVLLPVFTNEASFGIKAGLKGHGFYDENKYDDAYAEYTGAEKRTFYEMQKRRFQNVQEDKAEKRDTVDDFLLRELTREERTGTETSDEEYPYDMKGNDARYFDFGEVDSFDETPQSDELKDQIEDGVGTARDDLALKREEEKQNREKIEERRKFLPDDGDLFEGDMVMDARLRSWVTGQYDKRDAINDDTYLWPKSQEGHVRVPYSLSDEIMEDDEKMDSIHKAVDAFNRFTCIRFVRLDDNSDDLDRVKFKINGTMCYSSVGRIGGNQDISIGNGCERVGTVIHEMMHTIGFIHEQSRPDRDKYITVFYDHIKTGMEHNFQKYTRGEVRTLPTNQGFYDYDSCLHYNNHAFSKDDHDTIQSKQDPERRFGQRDSFSTHDILQINQLYNCQVENLDQKMEDIHYQ